jgi:hypothetical protein
MANFTLNSHDDIHRIIKSGKPKETKNQKVLPKWKQEIFKALHGLSGDEYQEELKKARVKRMTRDS